MTTQTKAAATIEELYEIDGKAEIVNGEFILMSPTGKRPNRAAGKIYRRLDDYELDTGLGYAFTDNIAYVVDLPNRRTFSPDASFFVGELDMSGDEAADFVAGAPTLAVEVRSKNDYGPKAEKRIKEKIREYFDAGTLVVWDADVLRDMLIRVYREGDLENPTVYRLGDLAEAEPALPGWKFAVDDLFK